MGYDLQRLVHEDARRNRKAYPMIRRLDPNIDHRRVPNLVVFFTRHGLSSGDAHWRPGDFVRWKLPSGRDHVGILTDRRGPSGDWGVIHNLSRPAEDDCLHAWRVVGHFRYPVAR